jgi:hypothetical protein
MRPKNFFNHDPSSPFREGRVDTVHGFHRKFNVSPGESTEHLLVSAKGRSVNRFSGGIGLVKRNLRNISAGIARLKASNQVII